MKTPISNPQKVVTILHRDGDTADIVKSLLLVANMDYQAGQVSEFAQRFKGSNATDQYEKLKELWRFTRREIRYEEDPKGQQLIKDPARVYHDSLKGDGTDCKSLSLFEYSVCRAIGIPCYFEFVSFFSKLEDRGQRFTHVYPVAIVPGIGEVVLDAVHTKFDERPPYITRVGKKYTKVFSTMTEIAHIANIRKDVTPTAQDLRSEARDRAKLVKPLSFVDYSIMTEGEMTTFLLAQQAKLYSEFYQGTPQGSAAAADYMKHRDALYKGLHTGFNILPGVKTKTRSASGYLTMQERGIDLKKGFPALFDDAENGAAKVGATIPKLDCAALFPGSGISQQLKRAACETENKWRTSLNQYWPQGAPALLYEFLLNNDFPSYLIGADADRLINKRNQHQQFVQDVQVASKISRENLRIWLQNGIIKSSIDGRNGKTLGPLNAGQFIAGLRENADVKVSGFAEALVSVAIDVLEHTYNQFTLFVGVVKGDISFKEAVAQHISNIEQFFKDNLDEIKALAKNSDFAKPGADCTPLDCGEGFIFDPATCLCVPPGGGGGTGSGFFANLSDNEKLGLAAAAVAVLVVASRK